MRDVLYRADASKKNGHGHVVRGISLSQLLGIKNFYMVSSNIPKKLKTRIKEENIHLVDISSEKDFLLRLNERTEETIVVLDGYSFDYEYQKKIKNTGHKVVVIDDWGGGKFCADAVINHNLGLDHQNYEVKGQLYTGPDYLLVRKAFLKKEHDNHQKRKGDGNEIFVCIGGTDPKNLTHNILKSLQHGDFKLHVVSNKSYSNNKNNIKYYNDLSANEMADLLRNCDYGIIPASTLMHEAACCRLKILLGYYVENQKKAYQEFINKRLAMPLGELDKLDFERIQQAIETFHSDILQNVKRTYELNSKGKLKEVFEDV